MDAGASFTELYNEHAVVAILAVSVNRPAMALVIDNGSDIFARR